MPTIPHNQFVTKICDDQIFISKIRILIESVFDLRFVLPGKPPGRSHWSQKVARAAALPSFQRRKGRRPGEAGMARSGGRKKGRRKAMLRGSFPNRNEAHARRSNSWRNTLAEAQPKGVAKRSRGGRRGRGGRKLSLIHI